MERWQEVFTRGIVPQLSTRALTFLARGLASNDKRLIQGHTVEPLPLPGLTDWPVVAGDAVVYALAQAGEVSTVGEAEEAFARIAFECDQLVGEPAGCRHWMVAWDDSPRELLFRAMLPLVEAALAERRRANKAG